MKECKENAEKLCSAWYNYNVSPRISLYNNTVKEIEDCEKRVVGKIKIIQPHWSGKYGKNHEKISYIKRSWKIVLLSMNQTAYLSLSSPSHSADRRSIAMIYGFNLLAHEALSATRDT